MIRSVVNYRFTLFGGEKMETKVLEDVRFGDLVTFEVEGIDMFFQPTKGLGIGLVWRNKSGQNNIRIIDATSLRYEIPITNPRICSNLVVLTHAGTTKIEKLFPKRKFGRCLVKALLRALHNKNPF